MIEADFNLVDHDGRGVTPASYAGRYMLVFFGFTHCKVVCPRALGRLSEVLDRLGTEADDIVPLYVSVDPERDSPDVMKTFLSRDYPRFTGLTGSREQCDAAKSAFRVFAERKAVPEDPDGYDIPHTAFAYLLNRSGNYIAHFGDHLDAEETERRLRAAIAAHETAPH